MVISMSSIATSGSPKSHFTVRVFCVRFVDVTDIFTVYGSLFAENGGAFVKDLNKFDAKTRGDVSLGFPAQNFHADGAGENGTIILVVKKLEAALVR